ncbi:allantoate amidohydrolase [Marinimicrobium sp. ARAG 43.8]|uniref:allantoate amidohydrolase n=1 Tax=Marinimicrobium sp. ARAG 43.8 TaxID=3418719 RepID=UPI003CEF0109
MSSRTLEDMARQVWDWCETLATFSSDEAALSRFYLTAEHRQANDQVAKWMQASGMSTREDAAGNLWGHYPAAPDAPTPVKRLVLGSHLDTVPNAGRYDGMLGVMLATAAVGLLNEEGIQLPFSIDVVGFGDEEGVRFGTTLLGSRAVAGTWQDDWWALQDRDGVTLAEAFKAFGLDPARIGEAALAPEDVLGYLEVHIEQGPVLEERGLPLGIVSGIAGARRFHVDFTGFAGHAGTVPMAMRRDAMAGAAEWLLAVEQVARDVDVVATVGQVDCRPGGVNVIPGQARLSLDIRSGDDARRDSAVERLKALASEIAHRRNLSVAWQSIHSAPAVACAPWWQNLQTEVLKTLGHEPLSVMSGAGHDAMAMAHVADCAMYFVRCEAGISHHPAEAISRDDIAPALAALKETLLQLSGYNSASRCH